MVNHGKQERKVWQNQILPLLWRGLVDATLTFLGGLKVRNASALSELTCTELNAQPIPKAKMV
jgi:hypothetical protein